MLARRSIASNMVARRCKCPAFKGSEKSTPALKFQCERPRFHVVANLYRVSKDVEFVFFYWHGNAPRLIAIRPRQIRLARFVSIYQALGAFSAPTAAPPCQLKLPRSRSRQGRTCRRCFEHKTNLGIRCPSANREVLACPPWPPIHPRWER